MTQRLHGRHLSIALAATCIGLFAPAGAQAATASAITGAATGVTTTSATLTGTIEPEGYAAAYEFEYGTTTAYGERTAPIALPKSSSPEAASETITGLKPGTTYHYQLLVATSVASGYYYYSTEVGAGGDLTFKTPAAAVAVAKLSLSNTRLSVSRGVVSVKLKCTTAAACKGKLSLTKLIKVNKKNRRETLGTFAASIRSGHSTTVKIKLDKLGKSLITKAKGKRFSATLTYKITSTGKTGFTKNVTL